MKMNKKLKETFKWMCGIVAVSVTLVLLIRTPTRSNNDTGNVQPVVKPLNTIEQESVDKHIKTQSEDKQQAIEEQHNDTYYKERFESIVLGRTYNCQSLAVWGRPPGRLRPYDGEKKLCLDDNIKPNANNCIVYSFGINEKWSFDEEAANYGCEVYSFDPSMERNTSLYQPHIHFYKVGIAGKTEERWSRKGGNHRWQLMTFNDIKKMLGHENQIIDVVKMDVEFAEWEALPEMLQTRSFDQVKQLLIELHYKTPLSVSIVEALHKYGLVKANSIWNVVGPHRFYMFEVSYVNSKFV